MKNVRLFTGFICVLFFLLSVSTSFAQRSPGPGDETDVVFDQIVRFKGKFIKQSQLMANRSKPLYCTQILTPKVFARGYFDARVDRMACYATKKAADAHSTRNISLIQSTNAQKATPFDRSSEELSAPMAVCDNQDRSAQYWAALYNDHLGDVCSGRTQINPNGKSVKSIWQTDVETNDHSCPRVYIKENYYPPKYSYVDYSSAFLGFIFVDWVQWSPKYC